MLSDRESKSRAPGEADVVCSFDSQGIKDRDGIGDPCDQRVRGNISWLIAAALPSVVGENEAEVLV
jgi:hypothetical protein